MDAHFYRQALKKGVKAHIYDRQRDNQYIIRLIHEIEMVLSMQNT